MISKSQNVNCHKCGKPNPDKGVFCLFCGATNTIPRNEAEGDPYIGQTIDNTFVVESILGEGSMGVVYKARHRALRSYVALKILRHDFLNNRVVLSRFQREAQAASSLQHPNVVGILHYGKTFLNAPYIAMECLEGQDLSDLVLNEFPLAPERCAKILIQVCNALSAAHNAGIIHRDLKPANISIIKQNGEDLVKVLDFGIAKLEGNDGEGLTREGAICGTPAFMSPEQVMGRQVGPASDIFSLGSVFYFMLSGRLPFSGSNSVDMATSILTHQLPPPSRIRLDALVPAELEIICMRALEKDPQNRFSSALEMATALENALAMIRALPAPSRRQGILVGSQMDESLDLSGDTVCEIPAMSEALENAIPDNFGQLPQGLENSPSFIATSLGFVNDDAIAASQQKAKSFTQTRIILIVIGLTCVCILCILIAWLVLNFNQKSKKNTNYEPSPAAIASSEADSQITEVVLNAPPSLESMLIFDASLMGTSVGFAGYMEELKLIGTLQRQDIALEELEKIEAPPTPEKAEVKTEPKTTKQVKKPRTTRTSRTSTKPTTTEKTSTKTTAAKPSTNTKTVDKSAANQLYQDGQNLEKAGKSTEACKKYKKGLDLADPSDKIKFQIKLRACARQQL